MRNPEPPVPVKTFVEAGHALSSPLGRITISSDAIAHIVGETARECYGVVAMAGRKWLPDRLEVPVQAHPVLRTSSMCTSTALTGSPVRRLTS